MKTNRDHKGASLQPKCFKKSQPAIHSFFSALMAVLLGAVATASAGSAGGNKHTLDAMIVNLYLGSGTERILALDPTDPGYFTDLIAADTATFYEIVASQPQLRLAAVADQIVARGPDIVAVEEASLIRNQSPGDLIFGGSTPATNVVFDYLAILVESLGARGAHYAIVSSADEFDVELPMLDLQSGAINDVRLTDRDAILVRTDFPPGQLTVRNPQHGHFEHVLTIPGVGISVLRGWCSVDATVRGKKFRYICTHLEEETFPQLQLVQAAELLDGPANVNLPVILAGDFNADTLHRNGTVTYDTLIAAGFTDAWLAANTSEPAGGLTWGHDEFLADPNTSFVWRIDLVLVRGAGLAPIAANVVDLTLNRTEPPLWASDHSPVAAKLELHPARHGHSARNGVSIGKSAE